MLPMRAYGDRTFGGERSTIQPPFTMCSPLNDKKNRGANTTKKRYRTPSKNDNSAPEWSKPWFKSLFFTLCALMFLSERSVKMMYSDFTAGCARPQSKDGRFGPAGR